MAKSVGIPLFTGTIGILTSYKIGDQYAIKRKSEVSEYRRQNDYKFRNLRKSMKGFGGAGLLARDILSAWAGYGFCESDGKVFPRLNGQMFLTQRKGPGYDRGTHDILLAENGQHLIGFPLSKDRTLTGRINNDPKWTYQPETGKIRLWMPENTTISKEMAPANATHATLRLTVVLVSDYHHTDENKYLPKETRNHQKASAIETAPMELSSKGADASNLLLEMTLPWEILPHQNLVLTYGITYYNYNTTTDTPKILRHEGKRRKREYEGAIQIIGIQKTTSPRTLADNDPKPAPPEPEKYPFPHWEPGMPEQTVINSSGTILTKQHKNKTIHDT